MTLGFAIAVDFSGVSGIAPPCRMRQQFRDPKISDFQVDRRDVALTTPLMLTSSWQKFRITAVRPGIRDISEN